MVHEHLTYRLLLAGRHCAQAAAARSVFCFAPPCTAQHCNSYADSSDSRVLPIRKTVKTEKQKSSEQGSKQKFLAKLWVRYIEAPGKSIMDSTSAVVSAACSVWMTHRHSEVRSQEIADPGFRHASQLMRTGLVPHPPLRIRGSAPRAQGTSEEAWPWPDASGPVDVAMPLLYQCSAGQVTPRKSRPCTTPAGISHGRTGSSGTMGLKNHSSD